MIMNYDLFYAYSIMMIHDQTWYCASNAKIIIDYIQISRVYKIKNIGCNTNLLCSYRSAEIGDNLAWIKTYSYFFYLGYVLMWIWAWFPQGTRHVSLVCRNSSALPSVGEMNEMSNSGSGPGSKKDQNRKNSVMLPNGSGGMMESGTTGKTMSSSLAAAGNSVIGGIDNYKRY